MHLYQAGMPLSYIKDFLGHASVDTTDIYASADITMLKTALEKAQTDRAARPDTPAWQRKVDKASCISLHGNSYEVDPDLSGHKVTLRYDPFDLSVIQVWVDGSRKEDARPLDLKRRRDRRVKSDDLDTSPEPVEYVNFFEAAQNRRKRVMASETPLQYANHSERSDGQ